MAKIIDNKKGFKVIQVDASECIKAFGAGSLGICDRCGQPSFGAGYYVAVLNCWYCPSCYDDWMKRAIRYDEDIPIEEKNYQFYKKRLDL